MNFEPKPNDQLSISGKTYYIASHPTVPSMAFGQQGKKAIVYQLKKDGSTWALKIFINKYKDSSLVQTCNTLSLLDINGLEVTERECFTKSSHLHLISKYPEMEYSILMPWVSGSTWFDVIVSKTNLSKKQCKDLAKETSNVLSKLEEQGYAHCDISSGNVIVNTATGKVSFIDVEDMYGPTLPEPKGFPLGTPGYQHKSNINNDKGQWCAEGDRFAGAILFAEMLGWHDPKIRDASADEQFFLNSELQDPSSDRYKLLKSTLSNIDLKIANYFEQAWLSKKLDECPSIKEWAEILNFPFVDKWIPISPPPPPPPYEPKFKKIDFPTTESFKPKFKPLDLSNISALINPSLDDENPNFPPGQVMGFVLSNDDNHVLEWGKTKNANGYIVQMTENADDWSKAKEVYKGSDLNWKISISSDSTMYFKICAYNDKGQGPWSRHIVSFELP